MSETGFYRFAITAAIVLALIAGAVATGNYVYNVARVHQAEMEQEAQAAAARARMEANARKAEANEREAEAHMQYLSATVTVTLTNEASNTQYLWTATPTGTNTDGSTVYTYNAVCGAAPGQSCSSLVYVHRNVQVKASGSYWSSDNPNWQWQVVPEDGLALTAHDVTR